MSMNIGSGSPEFLNPSQRFIEFVESHSSPDDSTIDSVREDNWRIDDEHQVLPITNVNIGVSDAAKDDPVAHQDTFLIYGVNFEIQGISDTYYIRFSGSQFAAGKDLELMGKEAEEIAMGVVDKLSALEREGKLSKVE